MISNSNNNSSNNTSFNKMDEIDEDNNTKFDTLSLNNNTSNDSNSSNSNNSSNSRNINGNHHHDQSDTHHDMLLLSPPPPPPPLESYTPNTHVLHTPTPELLQSPILSTIIDSLNDKMVIEATNSIISNNSINNSGDNNKSSTITTTTTKEIKINEKDGLIEEFQVIDEYNPLIDKDDSKRILKNDKSKPTNFFSNIYSKIKYSIISPETEEALGHINDLLTELFQDVSYSKLQIMCGLLLLDSYYSNSHIKTGSYVKDTEFLKTAQRYMKFANASFGWKYVNGYLYTKKAKGIVQGVVGGDDMNNKCLCEYTGIEKQDIILTKWTSTNFDPGHFLVFDHQNKSVVLSIRGTFNARDVLTDLVAKDTPFYDGHAHTGILKCAQKKFKELMPLILEAIERYPGYGLIVVGHSLGAGVASLFTIISKNRYPEIPVHCYAYAAPCVASSEISLSIEYRSLIDTFVFNDDIVPRLCYHSLVHLKQLVCAILGQNDSLPQLTFQIIAAGNSLGEQLTEKISSLLKVNREKIKYEENMITNKSMLPPGRVYRIYQPDNINYVMEESNPSFFKEIIISNTLISDHMPDKYEKAFVDCISNLNSINPYHYIEEDQDIVILNQDITNDDNKTTSTDIETTVVTTIDPKEETVTKEIKSIKTTTISSNNDSNDNNQISDNIIHN
ncbi:hypothetical protein CYY_008344 [Polysphondylium violaceum]|uniref:sn-1-specific diacylglycerol lipase n=1 Tax=Polysphondylium violaceum TaxID=133409 RepID=A0A8J4PPE0_9MYCE|nr:hypothetical protein CYY_008344 [Polysphondylium violaceum]